MDELEKWLQAYEIDVRFPDVSGMEHFDMLMMRSKIAQNHNRLTNEQQKRLTEADTVLIQQASQFYQAIAAIADLAQWRTEVRVSFSDWWWYLDLLAHLPLNPAFSIQTAVIPQPLVTA